MCVSDQRPCFVRFNNCYVLCSVGPMSSSVTFSSTKDQTSRYIDLEADGSVQKLERLQLVHITNMCNKTRRLIGKFSTGNFISIHLHADTLLRLNISFIRPHLEYATAAWDPFLKKDVELLENVQKFGLRVSTKTWGSSYSSLLERTCLPSLKTRRLHAKLCNMFKITNGLTFYPDPPIQDRQQPYQSRSVHNHALVSLRSHSEQYFHSFFFFFEFYCCMEQTSTRHCWKHYTSII